MNKIIITAEDFPGQQAEHLSGLADALHKAHNTAVRAHGAAEDAAAATRQGARGQLGKDVAGLSTRLGSVVGEIEKVNADLGKAVNEAKRVKA